MKNPLTSLTRLRRCGRLSIITLAMAVVGSATAQENMVALGRVDAAGGLESSATTVGGIVTPVRNAAGDYTITITAAGSFIGTDANDFAAHTTIASGSPGDESIKVAVSAVTDDSVTLEVHIDDVEDTGNPFGPLPADQDFYFSLFRIPETNRADMTTTHLLASGRVDQTGSMQSSIGRDGIVATSALGGIGEFDITLTKPGEFATDSENDYVILLTLEGSGGEAYGIRGDITSVAADSQVQIQVHIDDVQSLIDADFSTPASRGFSFSVFQTTPVPGGTVDLEALVSHARVDAGGNLLSANHSFDGGDIASTRIGTGDYRVFVTSPGAFSGRAATEYVVQATLDQGGSEDEGIGFEVFLLNASVLQVNVSVSDLEDSGQADGIAGDVGFYLTILDTVGDVRPDLRIGTRRIFTRMTGNDEYGRSGRGQSIDLELRRLRWSRFFFALENDGNVADQIRLKQTGRVRLLKTKYFRISGGRENITGELITSGSIEDPIDPGDYNRYAARVKYRSRQDRPRQSIRLMARSTVDNSVLDAVRVNVESENGDRTRDRNHGRNRNQGRDRDRDERPRFIVRGTARG